MDKLATLQSFFSSFLKSYEETSIFSQPERPAFPYLTYEGVDSSYDEGLIPMNFTIWYREGSWVNAVSMAKQISRAIPSQGLKLQCDDGYILIYKSFPFSRRMGDDSDDLIKKIVFDLDIRFYSVF